MVLGKGVEKTFLNGGKRCKMPEMAKFLLPILILFVTIAAGAQDTVQGCPTITVLDPPGVLVLPGGSEDFSVKISTATDVPIQMKWIVSAGVIEKGQGENTLTVRTVRSLNGKMLYAEVEIFGLSAKCPHTAR